MNEIIIDIFKELIKVNEYLMKTSNDESFKKTNEFRIRSLKTGLRVIKNYQAPITNIKQFDNTPGIGKGMRDRINEIIQTKKLIELDELCKNLDCKNLNKKTIKEELLSIVGIGESFANSVISKYKITNITDFINLCKSNKIKVSPTIQLGIKYFKKLKFNIPRMEITKVKDYIYNELSKVDDSIIMEICGSYRRQKLTSNDIDVLVTIPTILTINVNEEKNIMKKIINHFQNDNFLIDNLTSDATNKYMGFCKYKDLPIRRIDIRFIPFLSWYPALLYFTGSKEFNLMLRSNAKKMGYKVSEYGIFKNNKNIYVESEEEIFKILGMKYLEPQERNF
jgi:DNA polymerase/3'-5' exonuclease PolX